MAKQEKSTVAEQGKRLEGKGDAVSQNRDYQKLAEINYAMPAVEYTDVHVKGIIDNNLSFLQTSFFLMLLGNMIADSGILHGQKISKVSKKLRCDRSCFYGKDNLIDAINATGMALSIRRFTALSMNRPKNVARRTRSIRCASR